MAETTLLDDPKVRQTQLTMTEGDALYYYPFAYKMERHTTICHGCGRSAHSTNTYKVFAHYLYTPHSTAHKMLPIGGYALDPKLPVHVVNTISSQPVCSDCVIPTLEFQSDTEWRTHLRAEGERRTAEARRSNELREIFGGPPRRTPAASEGTTKPKVSLDDFLKDL